MHSLDELPTNQLSAQQTKTNGLNGAADVQTMDLLSPESFAATSEAAEHWRKSWRDRQYAEAGPAEKVSRGDASVPMPLQTMQNSFARMRAIVGINKKQKERKLNFASWIIIFLMICLIGGLGAYIVSTYLPNSPFPRATHVVPPANALQPLLTLQGIQPQDVLIGQTIHLHGEHFRANDTITFLLDTTPPTPIKDTRGNKLTTQTDSQGAFDVTFPISGSDWTTGSHTIEAYDSSNLPAYLTLQVNPAATPTKTSNKLSVTSNDKPVSPLKFTAVVGQDNPAPQAITITNISGAPLKWSARAIADHNLSWLNINDNDNYGLLDIQQPHIIHISVNIAGLTSAQQPYTGQIVFTINDNQQLTVPVQLQIIDAAPEMVFSPDPIIAHINGNTCQPGITLTLINLGTQVINWTVKPDQNSIRFNNPVDGKPMVGGQLQPSGLTGDTQVLALQCNNVQVGHQYHVSVYANQTSWSELVIIQQ